MQAYIGMKVVIYNKLMVYYMRNAVKDTMVNLLYSTIMDVKRVFTGVPRARMKK